MPQRVAGLPDGRVEGAPVLPFTPPANQRFAGLEGIRGVAALFVVLHHSWLLSYPGFPANNGPAWTGPLVYGHFAVAIFIVLSGFSLAIAPARRGWQVGDLRGFAHRRAWRILPAYWPALIFSLIVASAVIPQPGEARPTLKSVLVFGSLLQDVVGSPSPNGAFWSIAVEAQLYLLFPLMVLVLRRYGPGVALVVIAAIVSAIGLSAPHFEAVQLLTRFTPQFALLFAIGIVAAGIVAAEARVRGLPWSWMALIAFVPVVIVIVARGSVWTVENYFWMDLAIGPAIGLLLAAIATGRARPLIRLLDSRPIRELGSFSYSLYLIHAPIVVVVHERIVAPRTGLEGFLLTLAIAVPMSLIAARLFAAVFEIPFMRHRTWRELRTAMPLAPKQLDTVGS